MTSVVLSCSRLALIAVTTFLPVYLLMELDQDPKLTVILITIRSLMFIFMRFMLVRNIQDKIGLKRMVVFSLFLHSVISLLAISNDFISMVTPVVISGLAHGALYPLTSYIVSLSSTSEVSGLTNAYFMFLTDTALFSGSILFGFIAETYSPAAVLHSWSNYKYGWRFLISNNN